MASQYPPVRGAAFDLEFTLYKNDGTIIANPGTITKLVSKDGVDYAAIAGSVTEINTTYGLCKVQLSADEMTADIVAVYLKDDTTGCVPFTLVLHTAAQTLNTIDTNVDSILADTGTDGVVVASGSKTGYALTADYDAAKTAASQSSVDTIDNFLDTEIAAILEDTGTTIPATLATIDGKIDTIDNLLDTEVAAILEDTGTTLPATLASILEDTGTTLPATLTTIEGKVDTVDNLVDTEVGAIKAVVDNILRWFTNKLTVTDSQQVLYADDETTPLFTQTLSDDTATVTRGEAS